MARVLVSGGIYDNLLAVLAVDDDNTTIKIWTTPGASTGLTNGVGMTNSGAVVGSPTTFNGHSVYPIDSSDDRFTLTSPISLNGPLTIYWATTNLSNVNWGAGVLVGDSGGQSGLGITEITYHPRVDLNYGTDRESTASVPADGTDFGLVFSRTASAASAIAYAVAGSALSNIDTWTANSSNLADIGVLLSHITNSRFINGSTVVLAVFAGAYTAAQLADLHSDPYGTLFPSGPSSPVILDAGDEIYNDGETGIVITGTNFGATQGSVVISPSADVNDVNAVTQTVTNWAETGDSITFTAVRGSLAFNTNMHLFVVDSGSTASAAGYTVQFAQIKMLKVLVNVAAVGATVDGVVFTPPVTGIVGAEIGEFTGKTIVAGTGADAGKGVLTIPVTDFGGSALAVDDEPLVYLKSATHFTPIWPGLVIGV